MSSGAALSSVFSLESGERNASNLMFNSSRLYSFVVVQSVKPHLTKQREDWLRESRNGCAEPPIPGFRTATVPAVTTKRCLQSSHLEV